MHLSSSRLNTFAFYVQTVDLSKARRLPTLEHGLTELANEVNADRYMIMDYLAPVVDGCRAALRVSVEQARRSQGMSQSAFNECLESGEGSFRDLTVCFRCLDTDEVASIAFDRGHATVYDDCVDADVTISSDSRDFSELLDSDSKLSPLDLLGNRLTVTGSEPQDVIEALGLLCFPALWRLARSGVEPTSVLSEDADSVVMAAASDLVTRLVRAWIDLQLKSNTQ